MSTLTQVSKAGLDEIALDHVFTVGASGTDHYTFQGEGINGTVNDPTLYLTRGKTYRFEKGSAHPLRIQSSAGPSGTVYNTGVTNNAGTGTVIVEVQHDAPDVLYYQCTSHANMGGTLYITGALADGGVTEQKLAANSVTNSKIVTGAIDTGHIADQAVTLAKLPHGTPAPNGTAGKYLRANNGADPTFEAIPATQTVSSPNGTVVLQGFNTEVQVYKKVEFDTDPNNTYKITINGPTTLTKDSDFLLPEDGSNGQFLKTDGSGNLSFATVSTIPADGSITEQKLGNGAVTQTKIGDGAIINAKIDNAAAIAGSKLADGGISTAKIADGAVTSDKIIGNTTDFNLERKKLLLPRGHQIYNNYSGNSGGDISNTYGTSLDGMPYGKGFGWKQYTTQSMYVPHNTQIEVYRMANTPCGIFIVDMHQSQSQGGNPYGNTYNGGCEIVAFESAHHGWTGGSVTTIATRGTLYGSYTTSGGYAVYCTGGSGGSYVRVTVIH